MMRHIFRFARFPVDQDVLKSIDEAAGRLHSKLVGLDLESIDVSDYNKKYLKSKLSSMTTNMRIYSYILALSLAESKISFDKFVFMDYGGGSGLLSLLAKEVGIGTVYCWGCNWSYLHHIHHNNIGNRHW